MSEIKNFKMYINGEWVESSSGRAHARTGDRYQDMKEMGLDPK